MQLADVDLYDLDAFQAERYHDMFDVLRREAPVHWHPEPDGPGFWAVSRHADLVAVNRDPATFSSAEGTNIPDLGDDAQVLKEMLVNMDPPKHTRYRLLVNKGFTPRTMRLLEDHLRGRARAIVDRVCETGECEFVTEVASELPLQAIAEFLGVPQEDRHKLFDWSNRMIGVDDPAYNGDPADGSAAAAELYIYANTLGAEKRAVPTDDIVSRLVNAEVDGDQLTDAEFDMFFLLLTVAGNETTRNATSLGVRALMEHPDQYAALQADRDLLGTAIEEMLRWATPVHHFRRIATTDTELGGQAIAAGDKVVIWHASANRDEAVFDEPHRFDVRRDPNEHVAFGGGGPPFCLGANLARMELRLIFTEILDRMPDLEPVGTPEVLRSNFIHGITSMPVRFTPTPATTSVGV